MVQIDVPVAFAVGSLLADAAAKQLRTNRPEYYYHALCQNNICQIFFFSWIPVYFLLNYFGWETTHMWWHADSVMAYPYYVPIFLVVFFLAANGGFMLGYWLIKRGHLVANRLVYLAIGIYALVWVFGQRERTFALGTYAEWKAGRVPWFYEDRTFLFMFLFTMVVWSTALAVFFFRLRRKGKHLDTGPERKEQPAKR